MNEINPTTMLPIGAMLNGRYRVERHLASGGFGNTYAAINEFGERVAVKEFFMRGVNHRDEGSTSVSVSNSENRGQFQQQLEKFKKEAMRLRGLLSPHIVKVFSFFEENGTAYYVMDYIDGESLAQRMERLGGQAMPEAEVRAILGQVLDALDEVHHSAPPLYHLDIKPGNIMVDRSGMARLIDFGASKQYDASTGGAAATTEAAYTKGYAPLEQVEGRLDKVGPWTDFYALGATLYRLLTAQKPPQYSDIQDDGPAAFHFPATVSEDMRDLIQWMMQPQRSQRPQTIAALRQRLHEWEQHFPESTSKPEPTPPPLPPENNEEETELNPYEEPAQVGGTPHATGDPTRDGDGGMIPPEPARKKSSSSTWIAILAFIAVAVGVFFAMNRKPEVNVDDHGVKTVEAMRMKTDFGTFDYTGPVDDNTLPNGKGEATFTNGDVYKGPFVHGVASGSDAMYYFKSSDNQRYGGSMKNDKFARGRITMRDGTYFEGTFSNSQPYNGTWYTAEGKEESKVVNGN